MNYRELLREGEEKLAQAGIADASSDAWLLLEYVTGIDRTHYFLREREKCTEEERRRYETLAGRRARHVPVQYLTGSQEFMGYSFEVNEQVLIPRQDTELLVLEAEKRIRPKDRVLDMCTGSGCVIISLAKRKEIAACAADISAGALETARLNAERLAADVHFWESDLFEKIEGTFDCIVSNPPYIPSGQIAGLMPEVRAHEPRLALDGGEDGLYFYRRLTREAGDYLKPDGWLLFEIGYDQGEAVAGLMRAEGYREIEIRKDLAGLDRVAAGRR